jgi:hypothetical protein
MEYFIAQAKIILPVLGVNGGTKTGVALRSPPYGIEPQTFSLP